MTSQPPAWDARGSELAAEAIAGGEPTRWFDRLYAQGAAGEVAMPWDRDEPHPLLREWTDARGLRGVGGRAVVVGCGLGADAEHLAALGCRTTGFDIAETAVRLARERHPGSPVDYRVADLLDLPGEWQGAFGLVVEIFTLQALPDPPRAAAARALAGLVAPGGTLLAVAFRRTDGVDPNSGPPFDLGRDDLQLLALDGLEIVSAEELDGPQWRVEYRRRAAQPGTSG